ncbi:MAG TPA: hypothetical protein VFE05_08230 [Longimicrobiaceae bacterium]|jgi:hypothetical protein|nr:hypothetical protein [Longimicrobiaceae bacterium]
MRHRFGLLLAALLLAFAGVPRIAAAQGSQPVPLEAFVAGVARLWAAGDADALVRLAPADGRIMLDLGDAGAGPVQERQAAAALRALFDDRATVSVRAERVTVSGGQPLAGFGELRWVSRPKGVTVAKSSVIYVGVVWDGRAWHIRELRILG